MQKIFKKLIKVLFLIIQLPFFLLQTIVCMSLCLVMIWFVNKDCEKISMFLLSIIKFISIDFYNNFIKMLEERENKITNNK